MMKKLTSILLAIAMLVTVLTFAGCQSEVTPESTAPSTSSDAATDSAADDGSSAAEEVNLEGKLTLNGSTSMTQVCSALGEAFMAKYEGVTVEKASTGSGAAVTAVQDGTALIGDLSRALNDDENPDNFTAVTIALDGIAVVVNKDNAVEDLTHEQIAKIFTGEITNWSEVGGADADIVLIGRETGSGTRDGFEAIFEVEDACQYDAELQETGNVVSRVGSDANAIGYVSLASVSGDIKALKVDGVEATEENVANGDYVVQRPFVQIFRKGLDNDLVNAWFAFLASDEGQQIIADQKLVTVDIEVK